MHDRIKEAYGFIFEDELIQEIHDLAKLKKVKANDLIIDFNDRITQMPLLLSGAIKILRQDAEEGRVVALFFRNRRYLCYDSIVLHGRKTK